jgi:hypothetical protein
MQYHAESTCDQHPNRFDCPDCMVHRIESDGSYGLIMRNEAGGGVITINYCPWCGTKLPERQDIDLIEFYEG